MAWLSEVTRGCNCAPAASKGDARFDQWVVFAVEIVARQFLANRSSLTRLLAANVTLTGTYPDITFAASGGGGGTINNYITQSLDRTGRAGRAETDGPVRWVWLVSLAQQGEQVRPAWMVWMVMDGDGGYASTPAPSTWILAFAAAHG